MSRTDCKYNQLSLLYGDEHINQLFLKWLQSVAVGVDQNNDAQYQFLIKQNIIPTQLNDMWFEWLGQQGAIGDTLADRWQYFWCNGIDGGGSIIPSGAYLINLPLLTDLYSAVPGGPDATFARNSAATVTDHEGLVRDVKVDEARFQGARRVENLIDYSEFVALENNGGSVVDNGDNTYTCTTTASGQRAVVRFLNVPVKDGRQYVVRCKWASTSITGETGQTGISVSTNVTVPIREVTSDGVWASNIITGIADGVCNPRIGMGLLTNSTAIGTCTISEVQFEDVTDQTNQAPSEYVDSDTDYGANVTGVRYFATTNGNSVDGNGVVTEAAGTPITDIAGILIEEESENVWEWSDDITQPAGGSANLTKTDYKTYTINAVDSYNDSAIVHTTTGGETYTGTLTVHPSSTCNEVIGFRLLSGADAVTTTLDMSTVTEPTRIELNLPIVAGSTQLLLSLDNRNAITGANASTGTVVITGKQVEAKSYSTSLIRTSGAAATRLADDCQAVWPT